MKYLLRSFHAVTLSWYFLFLIIHELLLWVHMVKRRNGVRYSSDYTPNTLQEHEKHCADSGVIPEKGENHQSFSESKSPSTIPIWLRMIPPVLSHGLTLLAKDTGNPHPRTTSLMEKETDRYFVIWEKVCCWLKHEENEKKVFDLDDTVAISFDNKPGHPAIYITTDNRTSLKPEVLRTILIENGLIPEEERNCIRFYSRIGKFQRCSTDSVPKNAGYQPHPMSGASIGFTESALPDMAAFNSGTLCCYLWMRNSVTRKWLMYGLTCHHLFAEDGSTRRFLPSASKEVDVQQPSYWHSEFLGRRERRGLPHELRFGRLHYSSGYDICEMGNFQLDWALIGDLNIERTGTSNNFIPNNPGTIAPTQPNPILGVMPVEELCQAIRLGKKATGVGAVSGHMSGVLHPSSIMTKMRGQRPTTELAVIPKENNRHFCQEGDSGAPIYVGNHLAGMVTSKLEFPEDNHTEYAFYTPMTRIAKSILKDPKISLEVDAISFLKPA